MDITIALMLQGRPDTAAVAAATSTLESLAHLAIPSKIAVELLVVGPGAGGSSARLGQSLPVRFLDMPAEPVGAAQRAAIAAARGNHIVWIAGDVEAEPDWLDAYIEAFARHPDACVFAGKIVPQCAEPTPAWFEEARPLLQFPLGLRDFGPFGLPLFALEGRVPFAANFAITREAASRLLAEAAAAEQPDPDLLALVTPAIDCGYPGYWVPDAVVRRPIDHAQQTTQAIFDYYRAAGAAAAQEYESDRSPRLGGVPRWLLRRTVEGAARYHRERLRAPPVGWVRSMIDYAADRGAIDQMWRVGGSGS